MKFSRSLPALCAAAVFFCGEMEHAAAQAETSAKTAATPLEKLPGKLAQAEEEFGKKLIATRNVVDAEAEAKRISESVAQSLYWSLRTVGSSTAQVVNVLETTRVPAGNAALTKLFRELTAAGTLLQTRRTTVQAEAAKELRTQISKLVLGTPTVAEVGATIEKIGQMQEVVGRRNSNSDEPQIQWQNATSLLQGLQRLIEAEGGDDFSHLASAVSEFRSLTQNSSSLLGNGDGQERIKRTVQPLAKATAEKQAALDDAIQNRKPVPELTTAFAAFSEAAQRQSLIRTSGSDQNSNLNAVITAYRNIVNICKSVEAGNAAEGQNQLHEARNAVQQLGAARAAKYEQMLDKMDADLIERAGKFREQRLAELRTRLAAVKQPADLDAIAADLQAWSAQARLRNASGQEDFGQLASQLNTLAAGWVAASPILLMQQDRFGGGEMARASYAKELTDLRKRIERDVLAQVLKAPELNTPPLSEKPPEAALAAFSDDLAQRGEWRRLLQVLQAQPPTQMQLSGRGENETVIALRSFFAAQNFELAEQWTDAIQAYKAVLRSTGERVPTKPAAERLKALTKEHPEAAAQAPTSSPEPRRPIVSPDGQ